MQCGQILTLLLLRIRNNSTRHRSFSNLMRKQSRDRAYKHSPTFECHRCVHDPIKVTRCLDVGGLIDGTNKENSSITFCIPSRMDVITDISFRVFNHTEIFCVLVASTRRSKAFWASGNSDQRFLTPHKNQ